MTTKSGEILQFPIPSIASQTSFDDFSNFQFTSGDVIVSSYPKNGTTWLMNIIWLVTHSGESLPDGKILNDYFPFIECCGREKLLQSRIANDRFKFYHSHLPVPYFPLGKGVKVIHILRNPKDACTSFFHHTRLISEYKAQNMSFDEYFSLWISGSCDYGSYFEHVKQWRKLTSEKNILFLLYEDIKVNRMTVNKVCYTYI